MPFCIHTLLGIFHMGDTVFWAFFPEHSEYRCFCLQKQSAAWLNSHSLLFMSKVGVCVCIFYVYVRIFGCSNQFSGRGWFQHLFPGRCCQWRGMLLDLPGMMGMVEIPIICCRKGALPICFSSAKSVSGDGK